MSNASPVQERLRHHRIDTLSDTELLAAVIGDGPDAMARAERAIAFLGGLRAVTRAGVGELRAIVGRSPAVRIVAANELVQRGQSHVLQENAPLSSSRDVHAVFGPRLMSSADETVLVVVLDGRHRPIAERVVARGGPSSCLVTVRAVFAIAVREGGTALLVVHNHPSGDPTPSREDIVWTRQLARAGTLLEIPLVDHVIVARTGHASFLDLGLLNEPLRATDIAFEAVTDKTQTDQGVLSVG